MWPAISDGFSYLSAQGWALLAALFWFTLVFDVPRYTFSFIAAALIVPFRRRPDPLPPSVGKVSVILAGHNEADTIERCVRSLREQSRPPDEIVVVSDGSTDTMRKKLSDLRSAGLVDQVHCTELRAGKSAAVNLGTRWATGDIIVIADCDSTYHYHALKRIVAPFFDQAVGAVAGNILARNADSSFITRFQAIEYLVGISLGKQAAALIDQVTCVSGAFGAFRRIALNNVNGVDVGGGEDLDLTLKLREAGWKIRFAPDSICFTDVPATLPAFVRQRFRWERDAIRLRYRKHVDLMNPFSSRFDIKELFHEIEFLVFHVAGAVVFPVYVIWLLLTYGDLAMLILLSVQAALFFLDLLAFLLAAYATPQIRTFFLLPDVVGYSLFNGIVMRQIRLAAYLQEWIFNASAGDEYVPVKVRMMRRW